ncbi:MAG: glycosyltransferase [Moritella sp.]|uniref:glycosyltransferase family 2 protein n=1 Tax=Moritella sp. TaxID=78556 RepID=UPI0025D8A0B2|nr:glycosyltransferase family 2 protein [Moritella sp.]NQZ93763.1 glycosyltransferase [Moritella sp.]
MTKIIIGIPTFKRPEGLSRLLLSLEKINISFDVHFLVADNEGVQGHGHSVVSKMASSYTYPLSVISVPERGISNVRNSIMNHAFETLDADMLAMIDDDEVVESNWLLELVKMQQQTNADVVGGQVKPEFEKVAPAWTDGLGLYWRAVYPDGLIDLIEGTTSVLLNRSVRDNFPNIKFDIAYGLTGGGDKEFFTRLKNKGATFAFSSKSISHEFFGESRMTKEWAMQRAYRIGSAELRIKKLHENSYVIYFSIIKAFIAITYLYIRCFSSYTVRKETFHFQLKQQRQKGKLTGFFGSPLVNTYKKIHGK